MFAAAPPLAVGARHERLRATDPERRDRAHRRGRQAPPRRGARAARQAAQYVSVGGWQRGSRLAPSRFLALWTEPRLRAGGAVCRRSEGGWASSFCARSQQALLPRVGRVAGEWTCPPRRSRGRRPSRGRSEHRCARRKWADQEREGAHDRVTPERRQDVARRPVRPAGAGQGWRGSHRAGAGGRGSQPPSSRPRRAGAGAGVARARRRSELLRENLFAERVVQILLLHLDERAARRRADAARRGRRAARRRRGTSPSRGWRLIRRRYDDPRHRSGCIAR